MTVRAPLGVRLTFAFVGLWLAAYLVASLAGAQEGMPALFGRYAHVVVLFAVCGTCLTRAVLYRNERTAWGLIAAAMTAWTLGDLYFTANYWTATRVPTPTPADAGYLAVYPLAFVGLMLLLRARARGVRITLWVDGIVAALVVAAFGAAFVFGAVIDAIGGTPVADAINLAYPLGDLLLLGIVVTAFAMARWRMDRGGLLMTLGVLCFFIGDSLYLVASAQDSYAQGGALDMIGWTGFLLVALGAWRSPGVIRQRTAQESTRTVLAPVVFGVAGLGLLFTASIVHVTALATALATLALIGVLARLVITFHEKNVLLDGTRKQALTDSLTGLGNSRGMRLELDRRFEGPLRPFAIALFDLDGFKPYNDRFGHPAGDALLERAGHRLAVTIAERGRAYRAGGDEFCVLLDCERGSVATMIERCRHALSEHGEGFAVVASAGVVRVPEEATDASAAMRLADLRLYDEKHTRSGDPRHHAARALVQMLREQNAERSSHLSRVARLSRAVCRELGLPAEQVDEVVRAAELHDIGLVAIPDALLEKRGALTEDERAFVERHPVIGERVLGAAPSLAPIARIVRATHERWDGTGYPDGLAGEEIPLGARIILACNAYDAITSERPYRERRWPAAALAELWANAGTQLDPAVVAALQAAVRGGADVPPDYVVRVAEPIL